MSICNPDFHSSDFHSSDFHTTTVSFNFQTFITDILPSYFRRYDTYVNKNNEGLLVRYLSIFGDEVDQEFIPIIECYLNIINSQECDEKYLIHLSDVLGNPPDIFGENDKYRNLLSYIVSVYKIKGTKKAYELFFSLLGFEVDIYEVPLNNIILNYDRNGLYDTDMVYDEIKCSKNCSFYDITLYPKNIKNYVFTKTLISNIRDAIKFNEPINAKLRYLTLGFKIDDSLNIKINEGLNSIISDVNIYDILNEYDDILDEYDKIGNTISQDIHQSLIEITRNNNDNNFNINSSLIKNFIGGIDYNTTQLVLTASDYLGNKVYESFGRLEQSIYINWRINSIVIKNTHIIDNYQTIRLTGTIKLENGWKANINTLLSDGINKVNLYFIK